MEPNEIAMVIFVNRYDLFVSDNAPQGVSHISHYGKCPFNQRMGGGGKLTPLSFVRIEAWVVGLIRRQRRIRGTRVLHQAFERWFRYIEYDHLPIGAVERHRLLEGIHVEDPVLIDDVFPAHPDQIVVVWKPRPNLPFYLPETGGHHNLVAIQIAYFRVVVVSLKQQRFIKIEHINLTAKGETHTAFVFHIVYVVLFVSIY